MRLKSLTLNSFRFCVEFIHTAYIPKVMLCSIFSILYMKQSFMIVQPFVYSLHIGTQNLPGFGFGDQEYSAYTGSIESGNPSKHKSSRSGYQALPLSAVLRDQLLRRVLRRETQHTGQLLTLAAWGSDCCFLLVQSVLFHSVASPRASSLWVQQLAGTQMSCFLAVWQNAAPTQQNACC